MTVQTAKKLMELFQGSATASGTHGVPEKDLDGLKWNIKRTARTLRMPVTEKLWEQHVSGERPLGVIPIREDNTCSWGSIDYDVYDVDLLEVVKRVEQAKLPLVPCVSKSGGLHLFLFLKTPEPAADVQNVLREAAASLGMAECEIFPKQQRVLVERKDLGNWMVMPYFGHTYDGKLRMQRGLKKTGAEMTAAEFVVAAEKAKTTIQDFTIMCGARRSGGQGPKVADSGKKSKKQRGNGSACDFTDGPPCLQYLTTSGVQSDGRKRTLFMMALYFKRADPDKWKEKLENANRLYFKSALPSSEVQGIINSLEKKDYEYTCKEEPMKSHCNSLLCKTRKFGIGRGGFPVITSLSKLNSDPPVWFADVEDTRLELTTDELHIYMKFHRACVEKANKGFENMKQSTWMTMLGEALANVQIIDAPADVTQAGSFKEALEEFLTDRGRGKQWDDVWHGRPYEEDGKHYFRLKSLQAFLTASGWKMNRGVLTERLRQLGGSHGEKTLKGNRHFNYWFIPSESIQSVTEPEPKTTEEQDI